MENNENMLEESNTFVTWAQSFTKVVVVTLTLIYVVIIGIMIAMLMYELHIGMSDGVSTMITELNETFRVVIGGYLIKAAVENTFKISMDRFAAITMSKLNANKEEYRFKAAIDPDCDYELKDEDGAVG